MTSNDKDTTQSVTAHGIDNYTLPFYFPYHKSYSILTHNVRVMKKNQNIVFETDSKIRWKNRTEESKAIVFQNQKLIQNKSLLLLIIQL